jgi:hypothetical protein
MDGSNSNHTDRQYWAGDSMPASHSQSDNRRNSLGMVANHRRAVFSSDVVASTTTTISTFWCTSMPRYLVGHSFLLAWKRKNAREKGSTPSPATTLPARMGGPTQIGSKRAYQIKLRNRLTASRVQTSFAVNAK